MESVYDLTDSLYRQGWEHAESVDDYFYGDFPVLEMKHQVYAMTAMRRYVAKSLSTCETGTQTGEVCPSSWAAQGREERAESMLCASLRVRSLQSLTERSARLAEMRRSFRETFFRISTVVEHSGSG